MAAIAESIAEPFRYLHVLCAHQRLDERRRRRIREAMLFNGIGSIRVGRRVFECAGPARRLSITVLSAEPGTRPAGEL